MFAACDRLIEGCLKGAWIDLSKNLTGFDFLSFDEGDLFEVAIDARAYGDTVKALHIAQTIEINGDVFGFGECCEDRDGRGARGVFGGGGGWRRSCGEFLKAGGDFLKCGGDRGVVSCEPHCARNAEKEHNKETFFHPAKAVNKGKVWKLGQGASLAEAPKVMSKPCCGERDRENMMKGVKNETTLVGGRKIVLR